MMNTIRFVADMCHIMSILVLLLRLRISKNAIGVSIKTQELYLIVFVTRYLDLFTTYYTLYNSCMKILYISLTAYIIYMVKGTERFKSTFDKAHDSFLHWQFAVAPCVLFAVVTNLAVEFNIMEVRLN
jgi:ER lumen protein retaining receptor